jgi:nitric oxide reductase NorD protein
MPLKNVNNDPLSQLVLADPDLAEDVRTRLIQKNRRIPEKQIAILVEDVLWGLSLEISFGRTMALGYADLIGTSDSQKIKRYRELVIEFGEKGPTLGLIVAKHLVLVLIYGDHLFLRRFLHTLDIMVNKGTYTLKAPLNILSILLAEKDLQSASAYIDLLNDTFTKNLSYVQCRQFAHHLPKAVYSFVSSKRPWQIEQLHRVIKADHRLSDPFLDGLEKGLYLLSKAALSRFVSLGLEKLNHNLKLAKKFFSLESKLGIDTYAKMQVTVPLSEIQHQLNRYLCARTGLSISVRPLSSLPKGSIKQKNDPSLVCSDGKFIYLADEITRFPHKPENVKLYKCLTRLEAGHYEFGTFDFDLEKVAERCQRIAEIKDQNFESNHIINLQFSIFNRKDLSDLEHFFLSFPNPVLAEDLFTIFEHGRIRRLLMEQYPGIVRKTFPILRDEARRMIKKGKPVGSLFLIYLWIALGIPMDENWGADDSMTDEAGKLSDLFIEKIDEDPSVETCAELIARTYAEMEQHLSKAAGQKSYEEFYTPLHTPFGRRLRPDLFFSTYHTYEQIVATLKNQLHDKGIKVYKSDVRRQLIAQKGVLSHEDLQTIILGNQHNDQSNMRHPGSVVDLSWLDLSKLLGNTVITPLFIDDVTGPVFWYKEWDCNLHDYLSTHVRVLDRSIPNLDGDFYIQTLKQHQGLVKKIRYAFELLKPEGLLRLRQWVEGDEFDYRALLDFAIDKKAGKLPSDRLYIKRIKQTRDVAVLLLVDLSRSTANRVYNSKMTILDVEKEAIVLFCEALEVVGDTFAIAGFSGTGRLGVDYLHIKDFDENIDKTVKQRINAIAPRRSTRMGAAIRHATCQLEKIPSKVRLLIILGDGFPNDVDYKHQYAIEDTRKAIFEARSKNIFAHAITVHFAGDPKLDDLYGNVHHNLIADVRELPDKLLHIYSGLTRQ